MAKHRVSALILDEHNLAEMARHGASAAEVVQLICKTPTSSRRTRVARRAASCWSGRLKAEDLDPIDEQAVEVHDGHPVELVVSVRFDPEESRLLTELAEAAVADPAATLRAALRHYAAAQSQ